MIKVLLLMILCHIIDDFVFQPICLSKLKQREWWKTNIKFAKMYEDDYKMALFIHSLSWSIMISLPLIFLCDVNEWVLLFGVTINTFIHYHIDDSKANEYNINLIQDQLAHFIQILVYCLIAFKI